MRTPDMEARNAFVEKAKEYLGANVKQITRSEVGEVCEKFKLSRPHWLIVDKAYRVSRGVYRLTLDGNSNPSGSAVVPTVAIATEIPIVNLVSNSTPNTNLDLSQNIHENIVNLIPGKAPGYVPFGHYSDVKEIVSSRIFYPMFITGLSGNGKTMMVEQVSEELKRELIRANITIETDEDDLIGGFRLIDGHTVWQNGPVIVAMERGAVLLLDEVDLGSNKLMCLQPVLEGKSIYVKKINKVVHPVPGFTVIATANTKGKGSDDGRFIGTNVLNEAFLERFSITMEQEYPGEKSEENILTNLLAMSRSLSDEDKSYIHNLVSWAAITRKTFAEGAISELISTRRLVHIIQAFLIFDNRKKAIQLCLNRFDVDTQTEFMALYTKIDETVTGNEIETNG